MTHTPSAPFDAEAHAATLRAFGHELGHPCASCAEIRRECPALKGSSLAHLIADAVVETAEDAAHRETLEAISDAPEYKRARRNRARRAHKRSKLERALLGEHVRNRAAA